LIRNKPHETDEVEAENVNTTTKTAKKHIKKGHAKR